jgi:signal transduction histidine kinase/uncharacterized membrane protein SirB2
MLHISIMQQERFAPISRVFAVIVIGIPIILYVIASFGIKRLELLPLVYNPYVFISGISLLLTLAFLMLVLKKPMHSEENFWLIVYILLAVTVCATELMQRLSSTPSAALFWNDVFSPASFLGPALLLFSFTYTNRTTQRFNGLAAFIIVCDLLYIFCAIIFGYESHDFLKYAVHMPWGWDTSNSKPIGPLLPYIVPYIWYIGTSWVAIARLLSFRRHTSNAILKRQSLVFIFGIGAPIILAVMLGSLSSLVLLPPLNGLVAAIPACILAYGIYRYQVLTISPTQFSETILNLMQESVIVLDKDNVVLYVNPVAEKLLNISNRGGKHETITSILTPGSARKFEQINQTATHDVFTIDRLDIAQHDDIAPVPVRISSSRLQLTGLESRVIVLTDITTELQRRKVIEHEVTVRTNELQQARANLLASINSLQQGFLLVGETGKIELTNRRALALLHITENQAVEGTLASLATSMLGDKKFTQAITHVLENRRPEKFDTVDGGGAFYQIYITPVILDNKPLGATIIIEDQTEQKILDRSKDEFFSIASHELRTPLTAIRGNMSMAQEYFADALKDQNLKDLINDTHAASIRLITIVNDFLDSSKLEQGKMVFSIMPVSILPLVSAVLGDIKVLTDQQQNTVVFEHLDDLPQVMADEGRLRQILYNLLSNANKYCEKGTITISGMAETKKIYLRITDTGQGMSPENQKLLFHKFQQAGDSLLTRTNTKGTGLGLYISRLLAANMHGTVELERSEAGKGSVFRVEMPKAETKGINK